MKTIKKQHFDVQTPYTSFIKKYIQDRTNRKDHIETKNLNPDGLI